MKSPLLHKLLFGFLSLFLALTSHAQNPNFHNQALQMFPYFTPNVTEGVHNEIMSELIDPRSVPQNFPPFPRTWLELSLESTQTTSTSWIFQMTGLYALSGLLQINGSQTFNTEYSYEVTTSFIAISSLRPIQPSATENSQQMYDKLPEYTSPRENEEHVLNSILYWHPTRKRTYFSPSEEYPIIGLCKFQLSMRLATSNRRGVRFLVRENAYTDEEVQPTSYAIYSNFFEIKRDERSAPSETNNSEKIISEMPVQDYLRTKCKEEFSEMARYRAELEFYTVIRDIYANYHPNAPCVLPDPYEPVNPRGDDSCRDWHNNPRNVMGSYRRITVPRCVLGREGIPVCIARSKSGVLCPVYRNSNGQISDQRLSRNDPQLTAASGQLIPCDAGLRCLPREGEWSDYDLPWHGRFTGVEARCQRR